MKIYKVKLKPTERKLEIVKAKGEGMNPEDSKKLEEARKDYDDGRYLNAGGNYVKVLENHIKEQDREIERLEELAYLGEHHFPELTYKARLEELVSDFRKAEAELEAQLATYQAKIKRIDELENINRLYAEGAIKGNARVLEAERKVYIYENRLIHVFQDQVWVEKQKE